MNRLLYISLCLSISYFIAFAQDGSFGFSNVQPHTHALIIGIADYRNISDLEFADDDALAFRQYLTKTVLCKQDTNNIRVFLNEEAISSNIYAALENLVSFAKEGDRVYIYFSGHGDSENATIFKSGFLLTHETPAHSYYTNSINVDILNNFIHTLSIQNKSDVIFIGDACHSGNLKASSSSTVVTTAKALSQNIAEEVRMLSCQPDEISIEGKQWGNGRGLFSYHLINGLYGKADMGETGDRKISLNELNIYLSTNVPKDAHPVSQYPGIYGPLKKEIAVVNETMLAIIDEDKVPSISSSLTYSQGKGYEDMFLKDLSAQQKEDYDAFKASLIEERLNKPTQNNALYFLEKLEEANVEPNLTNLLKRNLIAKLQESPQLYINDLTDVERRWKEKDIKYAQWTEQLFLSAELMGSEHSYYNAIMAKYYFMMAVNSYRKVLENTNSGLQKKYAIESIKQVNKAIEVDSLVTFFYTLKGLALNKMSLFDAAIKVYDKAIDINPNYPYAYSNKGISLMHQQKFEEAIQQFDQTITLDPIYTNAYLYKIKALKKLGRMDESIEVYEKMLAAPNALKNW